MVGCVYENCSHLKRERLRSPMLLLQCSGFPKAAAMYVTLWQLSFPSASKVRKKKKESVRKDRRGTAIRDWRRLEVWHRLHFCWIRDRAASSRLYVIALSFIFKCLTVKYLGICVLQNDVLFRKNANLDEEALQFFCVNLLELTLDQYWSCLVYYLQKRKKCVIYYLYATTE